jgi:hypothetical protein
MSSVKNAIAELRGAILDVALAECLLLKSSKNSDEFAIEEVESSSEAGDGFVASFGMKMDGRVINFAYSLGYDDKHGTYSPYAEICGGSDGLPGQRQFRVRSYAVAGEASQSQGDVIDSIKGLRRECAALRLSAFRWFGSISARDAQIQVYRGECHGQ